MVPPTMLPADGSKGSSEESIAYLCHKLRTPLTSGLGFLQLALRQERQREDPSNLHNLEMVDAQMRRISAMIDELARSGGEDS